ncbi:probable G-protein coupled receptor 156 [Sardina pilchardus]|uniref:probable G-protein coupled receptor 156 n=1 Tax=Sardina pilchardus TaxID=27697 RepID=UPI002E111D51
MQSGPNCSSECVSGVCYIHPTLSSQEGWDVLQRLCTLTTGRVVEMQGRSLSPVLCAVVWTLLSCGILLAIFFLLFTLRFRNNRIVKMSSPNLNVLTLCGSILTYSSGFLFAIEERTLMQGVGPRAVLQARIWTLCIGTTLVFGPILGKTWRLYRVFTQRIPDKRVIIRDIQLMGLVALLILVDILVLGTWGLADPIKCARSVGAVVKVVEVDVSYSLSHLDSCSSQYSDIWVILLSILKGSLLLYGTYLAGLTSNVSLPPVNQSLTIMAAVCLVTVSSSVAIPVSRYLQAWPNVVYSVVSGAIFICTLAIDCLLFVPQLTQWRQFEEEMNPNPSQMSKYFSSPSRSVRSMYSEDEIYYLLGENTSMKRLINEKNAVIDSLQEQVNNAKDKLLKLMGHPPMEGEMDSSNTNLNSCSTQTTVVQPDMPATTPPSPESEPSVSTLPLPPPMPLPLPMLASPPPYLAPPPAPPSALAPPPASSANNERSHSNQRRAVLPPERFSSDDVPSKPHVGSNSGLGLATVEEVSETGPVPNPNQVPPGSALLSPTRPGAARPDSVGPAEDAIVTSPPVTGGAWQGFVSNEQLQEILKELSVDARGRSASFRSPDPTRRPSAGQPPDELSPLSPRSRPCSPFYFHYPSISPYAMRKRRPPFYPHRSGPHGAALGPPPPPPAVVAGRCRRTGRPDRQQSQETGEPTSDPGLVLRDEEGTKEAEADEAEERGARASPRWQRRRERRRERRRRTPAPRRCSITPYSGQTAPRLAPSDPEGVGRRNQEVELGSADPYGYLDSDSDSSSEEDYCYYHRPYCDSCRQGSYASSSDSTSETSDSEYGAVFDLCHATHPVVNFNEDLKPTFV